MRRHSKDPTAGGSRQMSAQTPQPSPEHFFRMVNSYQATAALKAAVELELFTAIAEGNRTAQSIAERCGASERGVRILCDYLVVVGLLTKDEGVYGLTQDSAIFLDRRSPAHMGGSLELLLAPAVIANTEGPAGVGRRGVGGWLEFVRAPPRIANFDDVAGVVRRGGALSEAGGTVSVENPLWVKFARAMAPMAAPVAGALAPLAGGGSGGGRGGGRCAGHGPQRLG